MRIITEIGIISNKMKEDKLSAFAAEATLFIILSFVPFLMLLLTLVKYTPLSEGMLFQFVSGFAPDAFKEALESVIVSLYSGSGSGIIVFTVISTLWAAGKGFVSLIDGLNSVFEIKERRNWLTIRLYGILYTVVFIIIIVLCIVAFILAGQLIGIIRRFAPMIADFMEKLMQLRAPASMIIFTIFFTFLYVAIPHRHTRIIRQLPGALFSALGWTVFSYAFSLYVNYSNKLSLLYGSLTSLIMIILWLYVCMYIFLIGAEINMYVEQVNINRQIKKASPVNPHTHS
ncbi:MAG: YihY/virulence factor BrkB family protein [Butyrivibrio sp.]